VAGLDHELDRWRHGGERGARIGDGMPGAAEVQERRTVVGGCGRARAVVANRSAPAAVIGPWYAHSFSWA
jgi:hypothetical protein